MSSLARLLLAAGVAALLVIAGMAADARAQGVGINATGAAADTSALLDLASTSKGLLVPRMTAAQRGAIPLPAMGLLVYQTDAPAGLYYNTGTSVAPNWLRITDAGSGATGNPWLLNGNIVYYLNGFVALGTNAPSSRLTVIDDNTGLRVQTNNAGSSLASFGGSGVFRVDSPGVIGGRLTLLENGNLGVGVTSPATRLDVAGGNGDVVGTEGDFRIGTPTYRLKMGVATGGGSAGSATIMEAGAPGAYNVLSLGTQGNRVLFVNGNTQRVGIGTDAPNGPLGFPPSLGKKITLYPGATGDVGLAVAGNRLQIYADNPSADVALGYDAAGTFNERFAFKPTGAMAVNGNAGATGQVLQSNGAGSPATWTTPTNSLFNNMYTATGNAAGTLASDGPFVTVPGLVVSFSTTTTAKLLINYAVPVQTNSCFACGSSNIYCDIVVDGGSINRTFLAIGNGQAGTASGVAMPTVGPGSHTVSITASATGPSATVWSSSVLTSELTVVVVQQ